MPQFIPLIATSALATWGVAGGSALTLFGTAFVGIQAFMVRTAIGLALYALTPKTKSASGGIGGYAVTATGSSLDHQIIYGRTKVGGVRLYDSITRDGRVLNRVIGFAGHQITGYDEIYFNDDLLTIDGSGNVTAPEKYVGNAKVFQFLGTDSQTYCTDLGIEDPNWTSDHKLSGIAYLYVQLYYDNNSFPNGIPNVTATIRGKPIYDPRTSTVGYSNNPALCIRDYVTSSYGLGSPTTELDEAKVQVAANICDETVESESRYTVNGAFTTDIAPLDVLTNMVASMAGTMWYAQGKWRMLAGKYVAPTVSLNADDLRSALSVSTRHSRRDNYNSVKGKFRGPSSNWNETDFPPVTDTAFLEADNGLEQSIDITLPFTTSELTAQRVARILLRRNRQQLTIKASFGLKAFKCQVGDIVSFTYDRFGWTNKDFEVTEWSFNPSDEGDILIEMTLRETSSDVFTSVSGTVLESDNTSLGNPTYVPDIGLSVVSEVRAISENVTNVLVITTTSSNTSNIDYVEVQVQKTGATNWILVGSGLAGQFEYPVADRTTYNIRARAVSVLGVKGEYTTITGFQVDNIATVPSDVGSVSTSVNNQSITLDWPATTDESLSHYTVRHTYRTSGASWFNSVILVEKVPRPASSVTVPLLPGTYMVKAVDKFGNTSATAASVVVASVPERLTVLTQTEHSTFTGAKTNTSVTSSSLRLTTYATAPATGSYTFSNYVDTGSVRECLVRVDLQTSLFSSSSSDWDSLGGRWDSWSGNFDDWGAGSVFGSTDVKVYVSTTDDNPAGSPTWSSYVPFRSGFLKGRAFRFKVDLVTYANDLTPSIDYLSARVEY